MKFKKIMASMLAVGVLVGSGYGIYNLTGKNIIANNIKPNVVYAEKSEEITSEDLKDKSIEIIKTYFENSPDFNQLKFSSRTETKEAQIAAFDKLIDTKKKALEGLKKIDVNNIQKPSEKLDINKLDEYELFKKANIMRLFYIKEASGVEEAKKVLETSIEYDEKSIKRFEEIKSSIKYGNIRMNWESKDGYWFVTFNDQTKELLNVGYQPKEGIKKIDIKNLVSIEAAEGITYKTSPN